MRWSFEAQLLTVQVFGNSNSLPISLVTSLSQTLTGLHWDRIPNDNDDEVAARGILYLLIFQQLGQLVRWSWGYHVLLAPKERFAEHDDDGASRIEQGQTEYSDNPDQSDPDEPLVRTRSSDNLAFPNQLPAGPRSDSTFPSGEQTPVTARTYSYTKLSDENGDTTPKTVSLPRDEFPTTDGELAFGNMEAIRRETIAQQSLAHRWKHSARVSHQRAARYWEEATQAAFSRLPAPMRNGLTAISRSTWRFFHGIWDFMNPPLWAMLVSIVVASVPALHRLFFDEGTFIRNSVTMAINQNGQVAVPLILVVLGANLARNTLPKEAMEDLSDAKEERNLIIASLVARMLLPTLTMAPILALVAKYVQISILDDPIFIIVCFLLTGAPSALQLAQICQLNNVYVGAMSRLLFQSYVVWYVPPLFFFASYLTWLGSSRPRSFWSCVLWRCWNGPVRRHSVHRLMFCIIT